MISDFHKNVWLQLLFSLLNTFADLAPAPNVTMNSVMHFSTPVEEKQKGKSAGQTPNAVRTRVFVCVI